MNNIFNKPYEISLWEDVLTFVVQGADGITEYEEKIPSEASGQVIAQYFKERKICVIGSKLNEECLSKLFLN